MDDGEVLESAEEVAVIGMAGRFPGARNVEEFWANLRDGVEAISFFSEEELESAGFEPHVLKAPNLVRAAGVLDDVELFDAAFFGFNPREAEITDPQHRIFLECAWEALEHAAQDTTRFDGLVGVYGGVSMNTYLLNLYSNPDLVGAVGNFQIGIGNDKDFLPTRVSYKLNLKGPSMTVQTACSTSLVAVHLACQSLLDGQCDMALAGGVSVTVPQKTGYFFEEGGIYSPDGHCRAFDERAGGFVGGNGVAVVVLKRLEDALRDGDCIYAVIKGSAINNDGSLKMGYTAPSEFGQAEVIASAQAMAGVKPETISYVEAHGTGTALGDPIEVAALTRVFRAGTEKKGFCAIGSVKTNVGHLDAAAGVTGLIKTVLALKHGLIPPSLNYEKPNPQIDFASTPFFVNDKLSEWKTAGVPRRAGVSSFGIGGTNAHVILEEAPACECAPPLWPSQLLTLSAKTSAALEQSTANLAAYLEQHGEANLRDVAYTLQVGRRAHKHRLAVVCRDGAEAVARLKGANTERATALAEEGRERPVVFMFSGQGAQYVNMGGELQQLEPTFRRQLEGCSELLKPSLGFDLRDVLYPKDAERAAAERKLTQTSITQPALFAVEYALAKMWMGWGVSPEAMIGHSIGEFVAACVSGVLTLEEALRLVSARGRLMQQLMPGSMLAVSLSEAATVGLLSHRQLSLAAINGPTACVVAGAHDAIEELKAELTAKEIECRRLETSHAFHSAMMEPVVEAFVREVAQVKLKAPKIPYISNVTGKWISEEEARSADYWGRHLRGTVRFADGLSELLKKPERILLEVGPGQTLCTLARRQSEQADRIIVSTLRHPRHVGSDVEHLQRAVGQLWTNGVKIEWAGMYADEQPRRVALPTYPFERERFWINVGQGANPARSLSNSRRERQPANDDLSSWFYVPVWKETAAPLRGAAGESERQSYLIFVDECRLGGELASALEDVGRNVITVEKGEQFVQVSEAVFKVNPRRREDYEKLLSELRASGRSPAAIIHMWSVTSRVHARLDAEQLDDAQYGGFYSLLFLAQALGEESLSHGRGEQAGLPARQLWAVTNNMQEVTGGDLLCPEKATILGPCRVTPQEYPNITCRSIDLIIPDGGNNRRRQRLIEQLSSEVTSQASEAVVAYRNNRRWAQSFEAVSLEVNGGLARHLRESGVYLITGGVGGIGLAVSDYLARTVRARLVLVGRTPMPERAGWDEWLTTHGEQDEVSRKIRRVLALEEAGAEVLVARADVTRREQMQAVLTLAERKFGTIHGVIHTAGVAGEGLMQLKTPDAAAEVLAAKVQGTLVLEDLLKDASLDFFALFSSLRSIQGGVGHVDYCAANAFLDAFAHYKSFKDDTRVISIDWGGWRETGMSARFHARQQPAANGDAEGGMSVEQGVEAFGRALASKLAQVIVVPQDLQTLLEESRTPAAHTLSEEAQAAQPGRATHQRPQLMTDYVAPRNEVEQVLTNLWQDLLGIEPIGVFDNFFELGGDSILSLRILARANREGLQLSARQTFEHQTIAELAAVAGTSATVRAEQGLVTGRVPLTPIQHWFFEQDFADPQHWNQSVLLEVRQGINPSWLQQAAQHLLEHHDALRMRFVHTPSGWEQTNDERAELLFETHDLSALSDDEQTRQVEEVATRAQAKLSLSEGHLLRMVVFNFGARRPGRLLMVIHHLVVDAVSWRILLDDLTTAYTQLEQKHAVALPPKTTSYRRWAERLVEYAPSEPCKAGAGYWLTQAHASTRRLPLDHQDGSNTVASARTINVILGEEETHSLLQELPSVYHTQINDVLLTALAQTLTRWLGSNSVLIDLEGHARETLFEHVDLTRTVGWFTAVFPVLLKLDEGCETVEALLGIKEQLRLIPHHGTSYGVLRYLSNDDDLTEQLRSLPSPEIGLLYLGQFDQELSQNPLFALATEKTGTAQSPSNRRSHVLDLEGYVSDGQLRLTWTYSENLHDGETIEALAKTFIDALRTLIAHCRRVGQGTYTPSDFPEAELSQRELDNLLASLSELED